MIFDFLNPEEDRGGFDLLHGVIFEIASEFHLSNPERQ